MRNEMVLYYCADANNTEKSKDREKHIRMMKSVLVRMGVRIKNIQPDQVMEKIGYLAGIDGYAPNSPEETKTAIIEELPNGGQPIINQDILVMKNFTSSRIDALLLGLRKAGVPKIALKAVITPQNVQWNFYHLYKELQEEHQAMQNNAAQND